MVQRNIPATITEERAGIPGCDELEGREVGAAGEAFEGFDDAERGAADAVGYVDYPGEFFEGGEEGCRDVAVGLRVAEERCLVCAIVEGSGCCER